MRPLAQSALLGFSDLSSLSTLVRLSNKRELRLPRKYIRPADLPPEDMVIEVADKSFLVIFC